MNRLDAETVKDRADIVAIIGSRVSLQKQGVEHVSLCPFHEETTASHKVNREKRRWQCFGCDVGGDVFDFVQRFDGVDFSEAVRRVAAESGIGQQVNGLHSATNGAHPATPSKRPRLAAEARRALESQGYVVKAEFRRGEHFSVRFEHPTEIDPKTGKPRKQFLWEHEHAGVRYSGQGSSPVPVYVNSVFVLKDVSQAVVFVEGDGKADGLAALDIAAASHKGLRADQAAMFAGRSVTIWPDADEAGRRYADKAVVILRPHVRSIKIAEPLHDLGKGADIIDAIKAGWTRERILDWIAQAVVIETAAETKVIDLLVQQHNDVGNAQRLIAFRGEDLRFCAEFRQWLIWDGRRWAIDRVSRARIFAQETALELNRQAFAARDEAAQKFARQSLDSKRLTAMQKEAEPHLSVLASQLDTNSWLMNFTNCTVDLRTSMLQPHRREDLLTKVVDFAFVAAAECPLFLQFLHRIMGASPDASNALLERAERMVVYLRKVFGYALTGITSEKAVFVAHGSGNNGKTTLLSLFLRLLDEYAALLQIETLMVRQENNNTQADLADLRGARYVTTSETDEGVRLAEGKLKRITQGMGKIKAIRKYENPIEFIETHKLFLDCNHKPQIRGTDQAIWNRLHLIPFEEVIAAEEIDRELSDKLYAEAEGILAWAVEGARRWHREGLGKPDEVASAAGAWRAEMNQIGRFKSEVCICFDGIQTPARTMYLAYKTWAQEAGEDHVTEVQFSARMVAQGSAKGSNKRGAYYDGLGLRE